jgi:hypothetical protein
MEQINETILKISQNPTNSIVINQWKSVQDGAIIYTANESINTKDLKPLQALIKEQNLTMMINYNIVNYDKITITILKKQLYGISPLQPD